MYPSQRLHIRSAPPTSPGSAPSTHSRQGLLLALQVPPPLPAHSTLHPTSGRALPILMVPALNASTCAILVQVKSRWHSYTPSRAHFCKLGGDDVQDYSALVIISEEAISMINGNVQADLHFQKLDSYHTGRIEPLPTNRSLSGREALSKDSSLDHHYGSIYVLVLDKPVPPFSTGILQRAGCLQLAARHLLHTFRRMILWCRTPYSSLETAFHALLFRSSS